MKPIPSLFAFLRRSRLRLRAQVGHGAVVLGRVVIRGPGRVVVGDGVRFEAVQAPIDLHTGPGGEIVLGPGAVLESGCSVEALQSVRIGAGARLGAFAKVMDNHFHPVEGDRSRPPASQRRDARPPGRRTRRARRRRR